MKKHLLIGFAFIALCANRGECQGTFQNLSFESAVIVPTGPSMAQFGSAFPGWTGTSGGTQPTSVMYDTFALSSSGIGIIDASSPQGLNSRLISGNYTAIVEAGMVGGDVSLSQAGLVPAGTESLQFRAWSSTGSPFTVSLGGQPLSLQSLGTGTNYTLYGADISGWAAQPAQLQFTLSYSGGTQPDLLFLDGIKLSTQAVPEPGACALCLLGLTGLWVHRRVFKAQSNV